MSLVAIRRRLGSERGAAMVEAALILPVLVFLAMTATPVVSMTLSYVELNEVSEAGARYATAAHLDPENPTVYRFRPDAAGVVAYVRRISDVPLETVTVTPDPATAFPGTQITVTVTHRVSFGPVGRAANLLASLVGSDRPFPDGGVLITSTASMREE